MSAEETLYVLQRMLERVRALEADLEALGVTEPPIRKKPYTPPAPPRIVPPDADDRFDPPLGKIGADF